MTKIGKDTVARVHYTGTLPDTGEIFDSSKDREPLAFLVGHSKMIPGFERELMGAETGDKVEFTLSLKMRMDRTIPMQFKKYQSKCLAVLPPKSE